MNISSYNIKKILKNSANRHKAFLYHYYSSNTDIFVKEVEKWNGKNEELKTIVPQITNDDINWHKSELFKFEKNLSGLEFNKIDFSKASQSLSYTNLDFCIFDLCRFDYLPSDEENSITTIFMSCKLNHSYFKNCKFDNVAFISGEYQNIVFYNCTFENVIFNKHKDGIYNNLFFQNCKFSNVNFKKIQMESCCFWGECSFDQISYNVETFSTKKQIGKDIIKFCKQADEESYSNRLQNQYIGGPYNKVEISTFTETSEDDKVLKYSSIQNCYSGLIELYKYLYIYEDKEGDHDRYMSYNYIFRWLVDDKEKLEKGISVYRKIFISRHLLGYGVKAENSLIAFFLMILLFSTFYLFSGIIHDTELIKRSFTFHPSLFSETMWDYARALYFSTVTSTTIGYGDIKPAGGWTMLIACIQGLLGILLTTMFIVVFGRKYFK